MKRLLSIVYYANCFTLVAEILSKKKENYRIRTKGWVFKGNQDYLVLHDSPGRMDE